MLRKRAFTLIELLIVVAIIAILAAIAVPNFLEAQVRAKVSRVKSDMRSVAVAVESYAVDNNLYPPPIGYEPPAPNFTIADPAEEVFEGFMTNRITTPIAYISSLPVDVFEVGIEDEHPKKVCFHYSEQLNNEVPGRAAVDGVNAPEVIARIGELVGFRGSARYLMFSHGPDLEHQDSLTVNDPQQAVQYDPTNGTVSRGDIYYLGPGGLR